MAMPEFVKNLIRHPLCQRLRYISQTGLLHFLYPNASHSRFAHSLGAAFLANQVFEQLLVNELPASGRVIVPGGLRIDFEATKQALEHIRQNKEPWRERFVAAALLHDVGHGPLSHTFERVGLLDVNELKAASWLQPELREFIQAKSSVKHEYISLLFIQDILQDLVQARDSVITKRWISAHRGAIWLLVCPELLENNVEVWPYATDLDRNAIRLLSPFISGVFDVDRLDYVQRDAHFAGVAYGQVEKERVLSCLTPVLACRENGTWLRNQFVAKSKAVHTLDHFLVALFEMYTLVYNHPSTLAVSYELERLVEFLRNLDSDLRATLEWYRSASDAALRTLLESACGGHAHRVVSRFFQREFCRSDNAVLLNAKESNSYGRLTDDWTKIPHIERPLLKDEGDVWLHYQLPDGAPSFVHWSQESFVAARLTNVTHAPEVWWRNPTLVRALEELAYEARALAESEQAGNPK